MSVTETELNFDHHVAWQAAGRTDMAFSLDRREKSVYGRIRFAFTAWEWTTSSAGGVHQHGGSSTLGFTDADPDLDSPCDEWFCNDVQ